VILAAASSSGNDWMYVALALVMAVAGATVPAIGTPFVASAALAASQGELSLAGVIVSAVIGAYLGGLAGYFAGARWGREYVTRPGRGLERRQAGLENAERMYARWGPLAVFFIPGLFAGIAGMKLRSFCFFFLIAVVFYQLATALPAYGLGNVATGSAHTGDFLMIAGGAILLFVLVRLFRRYRARRAAPADDDAAGASPGEAAAHRD
jgi:membrane protein DedA with SNARE-associated domain